MASTRTRGPNKSKPWERPADLGAVLRLALDAGDPLQRARLEKMFAAGFAVRRALQQDARSRATAYAGAFHERRDRGAAAVRERLGLNRESIERAAYGHLDAAPHLRRFVTKALGMHLADSVWTGLERHLFRDASGKRAGLPHVGRWFDFTRLPGRARSHTTPRKWETFRLHGTLEGHRAAHSDPSGRFYQPRSLRPVPRPEGSWWNHVGPLVLVFSGLADGDLVLPVRFPAAPSNQAALDHYLAAPEKWHKVDVVRLRDPNAAGGWRYEAHLMVLTVPYASPSTLARRQSAARDTAIRSVGIDVNVSNVTLASHQDGRDLRITRVARDAGEIEAALARAKKERRRARSLERSRRAANPEQYELSTRQESRARKRAEFGLAPVPVIPKGPRKSRSNGKPLQAFRKDRLSEQYRKERAAQAAEAAATTRRKKDHARKLAGALTLKHGFRALIEDGSLAGWARSWGRALSAFSPGMFVAAFEQESAAIGRMAGVTAGLRRASPRTTALSQHCLCGRRAPKHLGERLHRCLGCGLEADRDAMSALLATVVRFGDPLIPSSAYLDGARAMALATPEVRSTLAKTLTFTSTKGRQDAPTESTAPSACNGSSVAETGRTPSVVAMVARRNAGTAPLATPDETGTARTTSESEQARTSLPHGARIHAPLRDSS